MLLKDLQSAGATALSALYPLPEARNMVNVLCRELFGTEPYTAVIDPLYDIPDTSAFDAALKRLSSAEPLQYVLGKCEFYGRTFKVTPDVLIPRPETEELCREAMSMAAGLSGGGVRILDLCTGSGCIAWTMAMEVPGAEIVATDVSPSALAVASSQDFPCPSPRFVLSDLLSGQIPDGGPFDLLLSNPPYVMESEKALMRPNVLDWEPSLALFVPDGDPLLFYRAIAGLAATVLSPEGEGIVEINEDLGRETAALFEKAGFSGVTLRQDLSGKDRFVIFRKGS